MSEQVSCLLVELLTEQKKQTSLLEQIASQQILMIEVLADEQGEQDPDAMPLTYMDGSKVT
ncbi:hypothetical protein SAMN05216475_6300 [Pseudomonas synxantha]|jgi:hypothetical protein|uniref:Uncharacterized protein n=1 Tax=Pseudomonas synxantha TaxID=47883 RepID=A0AAX3I029_9PSED|nr:hypothetical protein [Pseudomonas synxantha]KRP50246.1 hypothetical protein TU77_23395 [Pseudomonas synxantha]SDU69066.1 hypothetical protein SAMN05216475_6300 [Pseudomonas synxantha]VTQ88132.1 Uncharacterised protein [Pseudomonas synxantha]